MGRTESAPSWPKVMATTLRLWLERRGKHVRTVGAVVSAVEVALASLEEALRLPAASWAVTR